MFTRRANAVSTAVCKHPLGVIALACSTAAAAQGGGSWRLAPPLAQPIAIVTIELVWYDTAGELRRAVPAAQTSATGYAVLVRDEGTGAFRCTVHAVRVSGSPVDGERTLSLGHEIAHCLGLVHR